MLSASGVTTPPPSKVLACVEHPFIVSLRYAFQTPDHLCFVLDYIAGGNMYSDLMRGPYTHERAVFYAAQIVLATQHLHELNILYRGTSDLLLERVGELTREPSHPHFDFCADLKPDNVLLTVDGYVKLADMGAARGTADDGTISAGDRPDITGTSTSAKTAKAADPARTGRRMTITGTHGYRAPEVRSTSCPKEPSGSSPSPPVSTRRCRPQERPVDSAWQVYGRDYGPEADWWNVGILIMEMLTAENPMRGELMSLRPLLLWLLLCMG